MAKKVVEVPVVDMELWGTAEAGAMLGGMPASSVRELVRAGLIKAVELNGEIKIPPIEIQRFIDENLGKDVNSNRSKNQIVRDWDYSKKKKAPRQGNTESA